MRLGVSDSESCMENAMVCALLFGWAVAWHEVGSIESKLDVQISIDYRSRLYGKQSLFSKEVSKICDSIVPIAHNL